MTRTIIAALTKDRVIGVGGHIPWRYPADLRRFRELTLGGTVIMGRLTWESLGSCPLPGRRNLVVSRLAFLKETRWLRGLRPNVDFHPNLRSAVDDASDEVWFIGGAQLYEEAFAYADVIDLTWVPDDIPVTAETVRFPLIPASEDWLEGPRTPHPSDDRLTLQQYTRKRPE